MNQTQYTTLLEVLTVLPDPRKARGQRYAWALVLTLLAAGLASGQQTIRAIAQWAHLHDATSPAAYSTLRGQDGGNTVLLPGAVGNVPEKATHWPPTSQCSLLG